VPPEQSGGKFQFGQQKQAAGQLRTLLPLEAIGISTKFSGVAEMVAFR